MAEAVVAALQAVEIHINAAHLFQRVLLPCLQQLHIPVAVVQPGQGIPIAQTIQLFLHLFLLQTVGDEELDGGQQCRVVRMLSGVIDAQKSDDARFPPQWHRQQALYILLLHHRVQLRAFYLPDILHEIDPIPFKGLQPGGNDLHRNFLQVVLFGAHTVPDELVGVHNDAVGCVQLKNIAAVCTKIVIDDAQQVMGRLVQIVPAAGELLDAAVQHRGDVQLFRQMRPARFQPEHLFVLLLDGNQEHQDHRNADGQIDQRQTVVHDLDRDREQRQHQIGPRRQKHAPADARPVLQQQAAVQCHGHRRNDHGNGIPCSAVVDIGRIERIIQPGELRYDHQRKAHTANGPHHLHPLEGCVFFRRQEHCTDVIVKKQQRQLHEEKGRPTHARAGRPFLRIKSG